MRIHVFSSHTFDQAAFRHSDYAHRHTLKFDTQVLGVNSAAQVQAADAVCCFVQDDLSAPVLEVLAQQGVKAIALRSAGYDHIDLKAAGRLGLAVVHVPAYSPEAVAEQALALLMALNRKTHLVSARLEAGDFRLDGLQGQTLCGKTIGVVGVGRIGLAFARIMRGMGCQVLGFDPQPSSAARDLGVRFVSLKDLLNRSHVVSLHCPLNDATRGLIGEKQCAGLKPGAILLNTSRGPVLDTQAALAALNAGRLSGLGLDVYAGEAGVFFNDLRGHQLEDPHLQALLDHPQVLVTPHQGFFTREALAEIADTSLLNLAQLEAGEPCAHRLA